MSELTQSQIEHKTEVLTTHGLRSDAQTVISTVGCNPTQLGKGAALLVIVKSDHQAVQDGLQAQKEATRAEAEARATAKKMMGSFDETSRIVFAADNPTLTALLLTTQYETMTGPDGQPTGQVAARPPENTADTLKIWRTRTDVAQGLDADPLARLAEAGWPTARLAALSEAVEAYASADLAQQLAIQTHTQAQARQTDDQAALRKWYTTQAGLCKRAIKDADPEDKHGLLKALELA